jgi:K+/H+ antiporter YhaU regulatory subunit KhtT
MKTANRRLCQALAAGMALLLGAGSAAGVQIDSDTQAVISRNMMKKAVDIVKEKSTTPEIVQSVELARRKERMPTNPLQGAVQPVMMEKMRASMQNLVKERIAKRKDAAPVETCIQCRVTPLAWVKWLQESEAGGR